MKLATKLRAGQSKTFDPIAEIRWSRHGLEERSRQWSQEDEGE